MKKYAMEFRQGKYIITEFNWSLTKDSNRLYGYDHIEDAADEMEDMNRLLSHYEKLRLSNS